MIKPIWTLTGVALLGTAGVAGAVIVASSGGEEEVAQDVQTVAATVSPGETSVASPSPTASPDGWQVYTDPELGFSFPHPPSRPPEERLTDFPAQDNLPAVQLRSVSFRDAMGVPLVGVSVAPNPAKLSLEGWIRTYPGWPCDPMGSPTCVPADVVVDGEPGIRFSISVLGELAATVYFAHAGYIYALGGNVFGSGEGGYGAAIEEEDFQTVLDGFQFPS
jgi:hypothetical protein